LNRGSRGLVPVASGTSTRDARNSD
jgi:hypothetical protein